MDIIEELGKEALFDAKVSLSNLFNVVKTGREVIAKVEVLNNEGTKITWNDTDEETAKAKYSVEYLKKVIFKDLKENVKLSYNTDYVLEIMYQQDNFTLKFLLAPRVEN